MELSSLSHNLDIIISNQDVENGKPNPEMYLKAMNNLGVEASECLILEDNPHGIEAAVASGDTYSSWITSRSNLSSDKVY